MDRKQLLAELQEIFRDIFGEPDLVVTPASDASSIEDWDSLAHINLVTAVEKRYRIKFALGELQNMKNVGDMLELVESKLSGR